jgi:RNA polymerase sigma-70 factor (ECF subfamily)
MSLGINKSHKLENIVKGCQEGNQQSQRELYERYSGLMYSICFRYVNDSSQAEDLMISGFMKIFKHIGQFKGLGSFEGWMKRIIVNDALAYIRKNKSLYLKVDVEQIDFEPDYQMLSNHLEAEDLLKLVEELPTGYKTIFNLYAIEGYTHKEIGEMLGISINTSKSQLSRARVILQQKLIATETLIKNKTISHE